MTIAQGRLDELWDFDDPGASERSLRAAMAAAGDPDRAVLATQVARALGLQERFADADAVLDGIASRDGEVRCRIRLERGRVRNSAGEPGAALPLFEEAAGLAHAAGLEFLELDALHMLAIVDDARAEEHARAGLELAERVADPRTRRWEVSIRNNLAWRRFELGDLPGALAEFERAVRAAERVGTPQQLSWAREALEECQRSMP